MDPETSMAAEIRALKREELSAMASVVLHELYFTNLSGDRKVPGEMMGAALEEHFGSVHRWQREFVGAAQSLAGRSGWLLLSYSPTRAGCTTRSRSRMPRPFPARCRSWLWTCTSTRTTWSSGPTRPPTSRPSCDSSHGPSSPRG